MSAPVEIPSFFEIEEVGECAFGGEGVFLKGTHDAIRAAAKMFGDPVALVPVDEIKRLRAENAKHEAIIQAYRDKTAAYAEFAEECQDAEDMGEILGVTAASIALEEAEERFYALLDAALGDAS